MRRILLTAACCVAALSLGAQTLHVSGTVTNEEFRNAKWYAKAMDGNTVGMTNTEQGFEGDIPLASDGFYHVYGVYNHAQIIVPLYLPEKDRKYELKLDVDNYLPKVDLDADNRALSAFNAVGYAKGRELWSNGETMSKEAVLPFLKGYDVAADSIIAAYHCTDVVGRFIKLWAYTAAYESYSSVPRVMKINPEELPFTKEDLLGDSKRITDTEMAVYFPAMLYIIGEGMPEGSLDAKLTYLYGNYSCEKVRKKMEEVLVDNFIRNFDLSGNFDNGLAELKAAVGKFGLDERFVKTFETKRVAVRGAEMPDVTLVDAEGNKVSFADLKGYYLYVDLWASWCGPCCKEAPVLQKLEKELQNKDVKFVSVSLDKDAAAWKKKMGELGLHGNQWLNQDGKLAEALNVRGIPFFLIYDKEGKLYQYNAPRPSSGEQLKELLENLH